MSLRSACSTTVQDSTRKSEIGCKSVASAAIARARATPTDADSGCRSLHVWPQFTAGASHCATTNLEVWLPSFGGQRCGMTTTLIELTSAGKVYPTPEG